jgi:hypothetical protein
MANLLRRALLPSLEILLFLLVFYISLFFMPDMLNSDGDLGRHITVGSYILDTHTIPTTDIFSHTRYGQPLVLHEWLSEVVFASAYRAAGLNGVAWLTAFVLALISFVLALGLRALGVSSLITFLATLAAYFTGMIHALPRPHLFTLLLFTLFLIFLELYRRRDTLITNPSAANLRGSWLARYGLLVLLIPLMVLWANFNGAFVLGFFVLGIYMVGAILERAPRRALIFGVTLVACFLATLVNPFSIGLEQHVFGFMGNRFLVDNTVEYLSPNFHNISAWLFAAWILFSIVLVGRTTTLVSWTGLLLLGAWTAFGLYSARNIPNYAQIAAVVTAPVAEAWLIGGLPGLRMRFNNLDRVAPSGAGWVWGIVVVALLIGLQAGGTHFDARDTGNVFTTRAFPVNAVDFIQAHPPQGNMFNEYTWGGYLEYRLFPNQRVFIDGDNDFYGEALVREYLQVVNAEEGWQAVLNKYNVQWVIVPPERGLVKELARTAGWSEVYRDEGAVVWERK